MDGLIAVSCNVTGDSSMIDEDGYLRIRYASASREYRAKLLCYEARKC